MMLVAEAIRVQLHLGVLAVVDVDGVIARYGGVTKALGPMDRCLTQQEVHVHQLGIVKLRKLMRS